MKSYKGKVLSLDFDGVCNTYTEWDGEDNLYEPREGLENFLDELKNSLGASIVIVSCRDAEKIKLWLLEHKLDKYISKVSNTKLPAEVYIDIQFNGDYSKTLFDLDLFQVHWKDNS